MLTRQRGVALAFATAGLAIFAAWQMWHFEDPSLPGPVTNIAAVPFSMFATACAVGRPCARMVAVASAGCACRRILRMGDRRRVVGVLRGRRAGATVPVDCRLHLPAAATERLRGSRIRPGAPPLRHPPAAGRRDRVGVAVPGGVVDRPAQTLRGQRSLGPTVRDVRGLPRRQSGPDHRALRAPVEGTEGPPAVAGAADGGDGRGRVDDQRLHLSAHVRALRRRRGHAGLGICHVPARRRRSGLPAGRLDRRGRHDGRRPGSACGCPTCQCRSPSSSAPSTCGRSPGSAPFSSPASSSSSPRCFVSSPFSTRTANCASPSPTSPFAIRSPAWPTERCSPTD